MASLWQRIRGRVAQAFAPPTEEEKQEQAQNLYDLLRHADEATNLQDALPFLENFAHNIRLAYAGMNYDKDAAQAVIGKHAAMTVAKRHPELMAVDNGANEENLTQALAHAVRNLSEITNGILDEDVATWYALKHVYHGKMQELAQEAFTERDTTYQEVKNAVARYERVHDRMKKHLGDVPLPSVRLTDEGVELVSEHEALYRPMIGTEDAQIIETNTAIYDAAAGWISGLFDRAKRNLSANDIQKENVKKWFKKQLEWLTSVQDKIGNDSYDKVITPTPHTHPLEDEKNGVVYVNKDIEAEQAAEYIEEALQRSTPRGAVNLLLAFDRLSRASKQNDIYDPNTVTDVLAQKVIDYAVENMPRVLGLSENVPTPQMMIALNKASDIVDDTTFGIMDRQAVVERSVGLVYENIRDTKARTINRNKDNTQPTLEITPHGPQLQHGFNLAAAIEEYAQLTEMQQSVARRTEDTPVLFESNGITVEGAKIPIHPMRVEVHQNTKTGKTNIQITSDNKTTGSEQNTFTLCTQPAEYDESGEVTKEAVALVSDYYRTINEIVYLAARDMIMDKMKGAFESNSPQGRITDGFGRAFETDATYMETLANRIGYKADIVDETLAQIQQYRAARQTHIDELAEGIEAQHDESFEIVFEKATTAEELAQHLDRLTTLTNRYGALVEIEEEDKVVAITTYVTAARASAEKISVETGEIVDQDGDRMFTIGEYTTTIILDSLLE